MRLRTLTGQRWPAKCADGCGSEIPAGPDVKVVVDLEARPRKAWIPEHSPDAGTWNRRRETAPAAPRQETSRPPPPIARPPPTQAPGPTSRPPPAAPPPANPRTPPPSPPSAESDLDEAPSPSPHAGRTWVSGSLSLASCRSGLAAHAQPGESDEELLGRVNLLLAQDLETKIRAVQALRVSLGIPERGRARQAMEGA